MTRIAIIIALALSLALSAGASAAEPIPAEVAVTVYVASDGTGYQLEWDGPFLREHGEEWCATTRCVNDTLAKIGTEWTYSVEWKQV